MTHITHHTSHITQRVFFLCLILLMACQKEPVDIVNSNLSNNKTDNFNTEKFVDFLHLSVNHREKNSTAKLNSIGDLPVNEAMLYLEAALGWELINDEQTPLEIQIIEFQTNIFTIDSSNQTYIRENTLLDFNTALYDSCIAIGSNLIFNESGVRFAQMVDLVWDSTSIINNILPVTVFFQYGIATPPPPLPFPSGPPGVVVDTCAPPAGRTFNAYTQAPAKMTNILNRYNCNPQYRKTENENTIPNSHVIYLNNSTFTIDISSSSPDIFGLYNGTSFIGNKRYIWWQDLSTPVQIFGSGQLIDFSSACSMTTYNWRIHYPFWKDYEPVSYFVFGVINQGGPLNFVTPNPNYYHQLTFTFGKPYVIISISLPPKHNITF